MYALVLITAMPAQQFVVTRAPEVPMPEGMVQYTPTVWTQEIAVTNGRDRITPVPIRGLEAKWHVSGGMLGLTGWKSHKYKLVPKGGWTWVGDIAVLNSFNHYQNNRGILRTYPDGTRFDDVLSTDRGVFEHRSRQKDKGKWKSTIIYENVAARPKGYHGLKQSCASCHSEAGSGGYAAGLVPGGDETLSDPLDFTVWTGMR